MVRTGSAARTLVPCALAGVLALAGCSGSTSSATSTTTTTGVPASSTAADASTSAATSTAASSATSSESGSTSAASSASQPAPTTSPTTPATRPATSDAYLREARPLVPHADDAALRDLRSMICSQLDATPSRAGVSEIVSNLVEQAGMDRRGASRLVAVSVRTGCAVHAGLVG